MVGKDAQTALNNLLSEGDQLLAAEEANQSAHQRDLLEWRRRELTNALPERDWLALRIIPTAAVRSSGDPDAVWAVSHGFVELPEMAVRFEARFGRLGVTIRAFNTVGTLIGSELKLRADLREQAANHGRLARWLSRRCMA